MQLTKKEIIQKLYDIEEKHHIKLGREVQKVVRNEIVPIEVIKVINKYDKTFLEIYSAYNNIYMAKSRNPLYRNLKNPNIEISELAIALSSLMTKILISCSKMDNYYDRQLFCTAVGVADINEAINDYTLNGDSEKLEEVGKQVRELLEMLYSD